MRTVPVFYVLDLDRCLLNTSRFQEAFIDCLDRHDVVPRRDMQQAQRATEATGGSFDTVTYVRDLIGEEAWQEIKAVFLNEMQGRSQEMFLGDATEFLYKFKQNALPFCIVTYGGREWQMMKLDALGLSQFPHVTTSNKYKGQFIAQYFDAQTHTCVFPGEVSGGESLRAERVCLIDDKAVSFEGLPPNGYGYWFVPDESAINTRQAGEVGREVQKIASLNEVQW